MKRIALLLLGLLAGALASSAAEKVFALAAAGGVDAETVERVREYLEGEAGVGIRLAAPVEVRSGDSLETIGRRAAAALAADEYGVLVLALPDTEQPQGVCLPTDRFGILNLVRLGEGVAEERLVRRAGQDGLRVLSMLLDMSPCPFPLCVLTGFEKTEDLDRMSGNFCPPCRDRFARLAREAGIRSTAPAAPAAVEEP